MTDHRIGTQDRREIFREPLDPLDPLQLCSQLLVEHDLLEFL